MTYRLAETDIYDFAGWLTTREGVMKVGASSEAGSMAEAVGEYINTFPERFSSPPQPTKLVGPNLVGILNAAGFYRKKDWVGLTEEEKQDAYLKIDTWNNCVDWIEVKLKEKNSG